MSNVHVVSHPLVQHKLTLMRDKTVSTKGFRQLLNEIGMLLAYEVTRDLPLELVEVETPLAKTMQPAIAGKKLVFAPILRAGVGFLDGMLNLVPSARVAHIGLYRDPQTLEAVEYYFKAPVDVAERLVIVMDPMLATGNSAVAAIDRLKRRGVKDIRFVCLLAAPGGNRAADQGPSRRRDLDGRHRRKAERPRLHCPRPGGRRRPHVRNQVEARGAGRRGFRIAPGAGCPRTLRATAASARARSLPRAPTASRRRMSGLVPGLSAGPLLAATSLLAQAHLLGQSRTRFRVGGSDHRVVGRKTPLLPIFFG